MATRVPNIILETIERNPDYPDSIRQGLLRLHEAVTGNRPLELFDGPAPDRDMWERRLAAFAGESWLDTEWFFAEMFVYRWMVHVTRFWATGRDLFLPVKEEEMATSALWEALDQAQALDGTPDEQLAALLLMTLWGNRIDLSMHDVASQGTAALDEHLLTDDLHRAVACLRSAPERDVHIVMDNAGTEQALDMALADFLLRSPKRRVVLHVKMQPVLVSDVIVPDIHRLLDLMRERASTASLGQRLGRFLEEGRLCIAPDFFWTTPDRLWELPSRIRHGLEGAGLVITKGDVNYRRATNDAVWPLGATLREAVGRFPAPLLAIRTLKSDTLVGVDADTYVRLDTSEPDWRTTGKYGVIQLAS